MIQRRPVRCGCGPCGRIKRLPRPDTVRSRHGSTHGSCRRRRVARTRRGRHCGAGTLGRRPHSRESSASFRLWSARGAADVVARRPAHRGAAGCARWTVAALSAATRSPVWQGHRQPPQRRTLARRGRPERSSGAFPRGAPSAAERRHSAAPSARRRDHRPRARTHRELEWRRDNNHAVSIRGAAVSVGLGAPDRGALGIPDPVADGRAFRYVTGQQEPRERRQALQCGVARSPSLLWIWPCRFTHLCGTTPIGTCVSTSGGSVSTASMPVATSCPAASQDSGPPAEVVVHDHENLAPRAARIRAHPRSPSLPASATSPPLSTVSSGPTADVQAAGPSRGCPRTASRGA